MSRIESSTQGSTNLRGEPARHETTTARISSGARHLLEKVENRTATIGVVGLGYVGLPFLVEKAKVGLALTW
jgi:hypothetical protein